MKDVDKTLSEIRHTVTSDYFELLNQQDSPIRELCRLFHDLDLHLSEGGRLPTAWNSPRLTVETSPGLAHSDILRRCADVLEEQRNGEARAFAAKVDLAGVADHSFVESSLEDSCDHPVDFPDENGQPTERSSEICALPRSHHNRGSR